jgi:hypothetical protein
MSEFKEFQVNDLVVCTDEGLEARYLAVKKITGFIDNWGLVLNDGEHWVEKNRFRHAEPEEIAAGHSFDKGCEVKMDSCSEAFERFECEKYECNYDDMKKNWDWYESQFGYRYSPDSLRGKDWAIWQKAWQHQQAKVVELQAENQRLANGNTSYYNQAIKQNELIEELQNRLKQAYEDIDTFAEAHERECGFKAQLAKENVDLQKRVDSIREVLDELQEQADVIRKRGQKFQDSTFLASADMMEICIKELEQALKGEV